MTFASVLAGSTLRKTDWWLFGTIYQDSDT